MTQTQKKQDNLETFDTDVARLLDIVANALYTNRDVFLRELISNAADACDRLRYESLQDENLLGDHSDLNIRILKDTDARTVTIIDTGIGMSEDELRDNLGTIARSGTAKIMEAMKDQKESGDLNLIGQFGVGFYSSFMIADSVEVISRKAGEDKTWHWSSDGRTGFSLREADADERTLLLPAARGTRIILHVKNDASDYLLEDKLKQIILRYSDHIDIPVYVGDKTDDETPVNAASALWTRPKNDITEEQYLEFYGHIGHVFDQPLKTIHWRAEGKIEYTGLLFIPALRPWDLYDPERKHGVRLYVKRIFITDSLDGLIYPWMRFLKGVIDSEDLPLNISREMLQHNPVVDKIRRGVTKKVLSELHTLSQKDEIAFDSFWHQFGMVIKEGLYDAAEHREEIFKICRFFSTHEENKLTSLENYISRMKDGQEEIYYMSGENLQSMQSSPQLEGFKARGIEVLFMTDTVDSFWLQNVMDYQGKKFTSVTKGAVDLDKFESTQKEDKEESEDTQKQKPDLENLLGAMQDILKDEVKTVRISSRLTDSPVCLVADDGAVDMQMERVLKIHQKYDPTEKTKVLEINPDHALIQKLNTLKADDPALTDAAWLLYDQALIIQGEPISDSSGFARRMAKFMESGL